MHQIPKEIISKQDTKFIGNIWISLFYDLETQLNFSTSYHLQKDGNMEWINHILKDMLRMYVMNNPTKWEYYLHLAEFVYINGYQTSTNMSPFEVIYGCKYRTMVTWVRSMDRLMLGPHLPKDLEKLVTKVHLNLKEEQDLQKSYMDKKIKDKYYQIRDHGYMKVKAKISLLILGR